MIEDFFNENIKVILGVLMVAPFFTAVVLWTARAIEAANWPVY